ncbi:MAG TPA: hypothetical protein VMS01_17335 [Stellaceae bacterium]|nr:hypothetical protein [Stellaceae bacterium]
MFIDQIRHRALENQVGTLARSAHFECKDAVREEMDSSEFLAVDLPLLESSVPFSTKIKIGHNHALEMSECALGASTYDRLYIGEDKRHLRFECGQQNQRRPDPS